MAETKKVKVIKPKGKAATTSPKLRIENNLSGGSVPNFCYNIKGASSKCIISGQKQDEPFKKDSQFSFNLTGTISPDHAISYENRNCTHGIEIISTPVGESMKVRAVPVSPFPVDIDKNVFNRVKVQQKTKPPTLPGPNYRRIPGGIKFINNLDIQVKIKIVLTSDATDLTLGKKGEVDSSKEYSNDSYDVKWLAEFQIIEAKCPHDDTCPEYATCKYVNPNNKFCYYHLIINSECYPIKMRVDDRFDIHPVLQFVGLPDQPENINISIEPDIP